MVRSAFANLGAVRTNVAMPPRGISSAAEAEGGGPSTPPRENRPNHARRTHRVALGPPASRLASPSLINGLVDVKDTFGVWLEAIINDVEAARGLVHVHYRFWDVKWDEWVPLASERIDSYGSHIYLPGGPLRLSCKIDLYDARPGEQRFVEGKVVAERWVEPSGPAAGDGPLASSSRSVVEAPGPGPGRVRQVKVKVKTEPPYYEWLPERSDRIHPFCWKTKEPTAARPPAKTTYWKDRKRQPQLTLQRAEGENAGTTAGNGEGEGAARLSLDARVRRYCAALEEAGLRVFPMGGDGNCLFRSVAHQVYGSQDHHLVLRAAVVAYMTVERGFFQDFVVDGPDDFDSYLTAIASPGEWGDDPEIQALCELYDRPAEIWAYDRTLGAKKIRTFHSSRADTRPPIRLSYFGGGHYDSVVGAEWRRNLLASSPGEVEERRLRFAARLRAEAAAATTGTSDGASASASALGATASTAAQAQEEAELRLALEASRRQYDETDESVEIAMMLSLALPDAVAQDGAVAAAAAATHAGAGAATAGSGPAGASLEQQVFQQALARSAAEAADDDALAAVLAASAAEADAAAIADATRAAAGAGVESGHAMLLEGGAGERHHHGGDDEEAELQRAMAMSLLPLSDTNPLAGVHVPGNVDPRSFAAFTAPAGSLSYQELLDLQSQMTEDEQVEAVMTGRLPARLGGHSTGASNAGIASGASSIATAAAGAAAGAGAGRGVSDQAMELDSVCPQAQQQQQQGQGQGQRHEEGDNDDEAALLELAIAQSMQAPPPRLSPLPPSQHHP